MSYFQFYHGFLNTINLIYICSIEGSTNDFNMKNEMKIFYECLKLCNHA